MFAYLFVLFGMINLHAAIVLAKHEIPFTNFGAGLINAFIFAKVMLPAERASAGGWRLALHFSSATRRHERG